MCGSGKGGDSSMANDQLAKHATQGSAAPREILAGPPRRASRPLAAARLGEAPTLQLKQWAWVPHASKSTAAVYSVDGKELFVATDDGCINVWNPDTYAFIRRHQLHLYSITALLFHPARDSLITASADGTVREWTPSDGTAKATFKTLDKIPTSLDLSKDGSLLAIGDAAGNLYIQSVSSNTAIMETQQAFKQSIVSVALHPSGERVAAVGTDDKDNVGILRLWSTQGTLERGLRGQEKAELTAVAFDPTGQWLAAGGRKGQVEIFNGDSCEFQRAIAAHSQQVTRVFFSKAGQLISTSGDGSMAIHKKDTWENTRFFTSYRGSVDSAALSPDEKKLIECASSVRVWNPERGYLLRTLDQCDGVVNAVAFSSDGKRLYSLSMDGTIKSWIIAGSFSFDKKGATEYGACALACSPDGNSLAVGGDSGSISMLSTTNIGVVRGWTSEYDSVTDLLFTGESAQVVAGYRSGAVRIWDAHDGKPQFEWFGNATLSGLSLSSQEILAASFRDGTLWVINLKTEKATKVYSSVYGLYSVRFTPNGQSLLVGCFDGTLVRLDAQNNFQEVVRKRHDTYPILRIDVGADGRSATTVDLFGTLRFVDCEELAQMSESRDNAIEKYAVAVHPTLKLIATGGARRNVELWTW
jgi:WD40 repeat protein